MSRIIWLLFLGFLLYAEAKVAIHENPNANWAVLVAGSKGWWNYRHQSDVFHAYQILRSHNIPPENIITFAFDDIANNAENPFPGKVFNDYEHKDVYGGVQIDYAGEDVTPINFMKALRGIGDSGKKVLKSGPKDNVFIFFSDHGAPHLIAFPEDELFARQLNYTITYMNQNKMYAKMVIYIEACHSASMFEGILPDNVEVFATTASNAKESSYAAFCVDEKIETCLADEYSHNWLVDSDTHDFSNYTLADQYNEVKEQTAKSHVSEYGDMSMGSLPVGLFQSRSGKASNKPHKERPMKAIDLHLASKAHLHALTRSMTSAKSEAEHSAAERRLRRAMQLGQMVKEIFQDIHIHVSTKYSADNERVSMDDQLDCYEQAYMVFKHNCFRIQQVPEVAQNLDTLVQLCRAGYPTEGILASIETVCS